MRENIQKKIKEAEQEILDLKTASEYTSIRSANYTVGTMVYTGVYRITYQSDSIEPLFSFVYTGSYDTDWGIAYPRTPIDNYQDVEITTDYYDSITDSNKTGTAPIVVIANRPVVSIVRL